MADMDGAYSVATVLQIGVFGLVITLAVVLIAAGTLVKPERRKRFVLWGLVAYFSGWTLFVLYNTLVLTRTLFKLLH